MKPKTHFVNSAVPVFSLLMLFSSCSRKKEMVVAEFGREKITLEAFRSAYLEIVKQPRAYDSPQLREEFLDELIQRRILAAEARAAGLKDETMKVRIDAYRDKAAREAHYQHVIRPQISVSESDIEEAYQFTQEERRVRHLFVRTREQADSLYRLLESGVPFETLAASVFADAALAEKGGDLGWVQWADMDHALGMTAFRQKLNAISRPVQSRYGWHILQVIDYKKNPLITRRDYELHRKKAKALLETKIGDELAAAWLDALMDRTKIQVMPRIMKPVGEQLARQLRRKPSPRDAMNEMQLSDTEVTQLQTSLWDLRNEVLATVNEKPVTVGAFVCALSFVPYDAVYSNYKSALDFVFRDAAINQEAQKMKLYRSETVRRKTSQYEEYLLQAQFRKALVRGAYVEDDEVQAAIEKDHTGLPADSVRTWLQAELLKEKRRQAVSVFTAEKCAHMNVRKYPERIHAYYQTIHGTGSGTTAKEPE